jgi:2-polyprenyl-6-methoxyphenol hydroxylase-like FAD-dependent oxidoreductase
LPALLDSTDDEPFFDRVREVSCASWHTDRVVLIGDAAHAVHPISGMGASLALQDARVLAQELATAASGGVSDALAQFEARRRPNANRVQRQARIEAAVTFLESSSLRMLRNAVTKHTPLFEWLVRRQATDR